MGLVGVDVVSHLPSRQGGVSEVMSMSVALLLMEVKFNSWIIIICYIYLFGCTGSWLRHEGPSLQCPGSAVEVLGLSCPAAGGSLVPPPGTEPWALALQADS